VKRPVNLRVSPELLGRVDAEADRLGQTRTKFVERALESALSGVDSSTKSSAGKPSAPTRAPKDLPKIAPRHWAS
jgi:predicted transcriptional regulator